MPDSERRARTPGIRRFPQPHDPDGRPYLLTDRPRFIGASAPYLCGASSQWLVKMVRAPDHLLRCWAWEGVRAGTHPHLGARTRQRADPATRCWIGDRVCAATQSLEAAGGWAVAAGAGRAWAAAHLGCGGHASAVVAVRRPPAGAGPGPGPRRRRPARSGCDGPGGRACGPPSGRLGCHLSGSSPGWRGRGRGRSGGQLRWAASNNAQRSTCGPWRDRWPGLGLLSELGMVNVQAGVAHDASPLAKRRASPSSARMVGASSIPVPSWRSINARQPGWRQVEGAQPALQRVQFQVELVDLAQRGRDLQAAGLSNASCSSQPRVAWVSRAWSGQGRPWWNSTACSRCLKAVR
jgi:hypothetical protein